LFRILSDLSEYWWFFAFSAFFLFQLVMMVLWPKFILPLFNKLSPLEDGSLKERLFDLAKRTGFAAQTIDVIDGSKRSSHSNAFFTGFGKFRRIVLYDTLINQMEENQVEAVLAHEIGHYKKGHIPKRLFFSFLTGLLGFYLLSLGMLQEWLYSGLNLPAQYIGSMSAVLIGAILIIPNFTYWLSPISNIFSRKHEYEADRFAKEAMNGGNELVEALRQLYRENLSHPSPHWLLVFFHYSHPTFFDRKNALDSL
jgi:STE24 endopeptidase